VIGEMIRSYIANQRRRNEILRVEEWIYSWDWLCFSSWTL